MTEQDLFNRLVKQRILIGTHLVDMIAQLQDEGADLPTIESRLKIYFPGLTYRLSGRELQVDGGYRGLDVSLTFSIYDELQDDHRTKLPRLDTKVEIRGYHYVDEEEDEP